MGVAYVYIPLVKKKVKRVVDFSPLFQVEITITETQTENEIIYDIAKIMDITYLSFKKNFFGRKESKNTISIVMQT